MSILLLSVFNHLAHVCVNDRFKRVGPNAMRGRGIGTARGRATIMRGSSIFLQYVLTILIHSISSSKRCGNFVVLRTTYFY